MAKNLHDSLEYNKVCDFQILTQMEQYMRRYRLANTHQENDTFGTCFKKPKWHFSHFMTNYVTLGFPGVTVVSIYVPPPDWLEISNFRQKNDTNGTLLAQKLANFKLLKNINKISLYDSDLDFHIDKSLILRDSILKIVHIVKKMTQT